MITRVSREVPNVSAKHKAREAHFYHPPTKHDRNMQTAVGVFLLLALVTFVALLVQGVLALVSVVTGWL